MKHYLITYINGVEEGVTADCISAAISRAKNFQNNEMIKVECIDKQIVRHQIKEINTTFRDMGRKYWDSLSELQDQVVSVLTSRGFDVPDSFNLSGPEGAARAVNIGRGVYLCVTWYQMGSGRYEFVGYVS